MLRLGEVTNMIHAWTFTDSVDILNCDAMQVIDESGLFPETVIPLSQASRLSIGKSANKFRLTIGGDVMWNVDVEITSDADRYEARASTPGGTFIVRIPQQAPRRGVLWVSQHGQERKVATIVCAPDRT